MCSLESHSKPICRQQLKLQYDNDVTIRLQQFVKLTAGIAEKRLHTFNFRLAIDNKAQYISVSKVIKWEKKGISVEGNLVEKYSNTLEKTSSMEKTDSIKKKNIMTIDMI